MGTLYSSTVTILVKSPFPSLTASDPPLDDSIASSREDDGPVGPQHQWVLHLLIDQPWLRHFENYACTEHGQISSLSLFSKQYGVITIYIAFVKYNN